MAAPLAFGRKLPPSEWEGELPHGPGGTFVLCRDVSTALAIRWATNGRRALTGPELRAAIIPPVEGGSTIMQAAVGVRLLTGLELVAPHVTVETVRAWLPLGGYGLIVDGWYHTLPESFRHQAGPGIFTHSMFVPYASHRSGWRVYDPLDPAKTFGRWIPEAVMLPFLESLSCQVSYIPLQPL